MRRFALSGGTDRSWRVFRKAEARGVLLHFIRLRIQHARGGDAFLRHGGVLLRRAVDLVHEIGSNFKATIREGIRSDHQIIAIQELTDNPFDWLSAIEIAEETHLLDSSFANLCEQMFQKQSAFVYLRSNIGFTPVFTRQRIRAI